MKRLLLILVILSTIVVAQQVTITVFGGMGEQTFETSGPVQNQYILGGSGQPLVKTYTFNQQTTISQFNVTIHDSVGACYRPPSTTDQSTGQTINYPYQCGTPTLCITFDSEPRVPSQCIQFVTQTSFSSTPPANYRTVNRNLNFALPQPKTAQSVTFTYEPGPNNLPSFKLQRIRWDGGVSGSVVKPINFFRNKTGPITLGPVNSILNLQGYSGKLKISSSDSKVFAYFGPDQSYSPLDLTDGKEITYNSAFPEQALACLSTYPQTSYVCDFQHEERCASLNSDWYNGVCCGDANVNPNAETPPSDCKYYGIVAGLGNRVMNAICGKSGNSWVWAGQLDPGVITDFTSCGQLTQVVATGTQFITCGNTQNTAGITVNQLQGTTDIAGHTYWCEGSQLRECGGSSPYSSSQYIKTTGTRIDINSEAYYCKSTGALSKTLDGDQQGCLSAGFNWTGTKCCGEPDDPLKNYNDPSGTGVCINNQVISQGSVTGIEQDILIHNGAYYFCNEQRTLGYSGTTTIADFPGVQINERGYCGVPLLNVKSTGLDKNAICTPQGNWQFVEFNQTSIVEQTGWMPTSTQVQTGCCPTNMCWDGNQCRSSGHFVSIGGKGYKCP